MFELKIETTNDAFDDGAGGVYEIARILRTLADDLEVSGALDAAIGSPVRDVNGNRVGAWAYADKD